MMRKMLSIWGIIFLMLALVAGTAAAQSGADPITTPTVEPTGQPTGSTSYSHPIIRLLGAYFGRLTRPTLATPTSTPTATPTLDPSATLTETPSETPMETPTATPMPGPGEFADEIAKYHAEGIGFGVLVKLYAIAEESVQYCAELQASLEGIDPDQPACEVVTVEQLVEEFKSGAGMGQLYQTYGKPALLGVGHVRKALQNQSEEQPEEIQPTLTPTPMMDGSNIQSQGQKSNNGNGKGNGNGNGNGKNPAGGNSSNGKGPKK